ncbi:MAG: hypothetical protein SGI97_11240 [candidate division Zixibacteria bacterium]|nr:hypothetical protein [candidate division Zixibacteria bacterium]
MLSLWYSSAVNRVRINLASSVPFSLEHTYSAMLSEFIPKWHLLYEQLPAILWTAKDNGSSE